MAYTENKTGDGNAKIHDALAYMIDLLEGDETSASATAANQVTLETDVEALVTGTVSTAFASSGLTAKATTTNAVTECIAATEAAVYHHVKIVNDGSVDGFFSIDGGTVWGRLPDASAMVLDGVTITNKAIQIKRVADGSNLAGVFVEAW